MSFCEKSFYCKTRQDLSINCDAMESLCLEIKNQKSKKHKSKFDI